jgi:hypothetical protein
MQSGAVEQCQPNEDQGPEQGPIDGCSHVFRTDRTNSCVERGLHGNPPPDERLVQDKAYVPRLRLIAPCTIEHTIRKATHHP